MANGGYTNASGGGAAPGKKKKVAIIGVSSAVLVAMVVAVAIGVKSSSDSSGNAAPAAGTGEISASVKAVQAICQPTDYKETCIKSLSSAAGNNTDPKDLIKVGFEVAINEITSAIKNSTTLKELAKDKRASQALENCRELLEYSIDDLKTSFEHIGSFDISKLDEFVEDLKIWLSGAITYQGTCLDGFENSTGDAGEKMKAILKTARELTSNGLAMVTEISSVLTSLQIPSTTTATRRLLSEHTNDYEGPEVWVRRRLLAATTAAINPDVVVAKDGTGKYKTVNEALKDIPKQNAKTFVIHVKAGVYTENVVLDKFMTNVMVIGDGPTKTKITGSKNFADGVNTYNTATFKVKGGGFMAKDIGFENTAGPEKHQAVALLVESDKAIIYNCHIDGYQDTLYFHSYRQFYRDCTITGTIDFLFGDAAAVFQNCKLVVRKPADNQQCIVTAQGRENIREPTALILQNCTITASPELFPLRKTVRSFLGRPWRIYSRTIIMQSQIDDLIAPEGFLPWMGTFGINTLFYAEIGNRGPGAVTTGRVKWAGIKKLTPLQAAEFTAGRFIAGDTWIPPTGVPYVSGMIPGL